MWSAGIAGAGLVVGTTTAELAACVGLIVGVGIGVGDGEDAHAAAMLASTIKIHTTNSL